MSTSCPHMNFAASVQVGRLTEDDEVTVKAYVADIRVKCADCDQLFRFRHNAFGSSPDFATVSVDSEEMRAPIEPAYVPEILGQPVRSGRA